MIFYTALLLDVFFHYTQFQNNAFYAFGVMLKIRKTDRDNLKSKPNREMFFFCTLHFSLMSSVFIIKLVLLYFSTIHFFPFFSEVLGTQLNDPGPDIC